VKVHRDPPEWVQFGILPPRVAFVVARYRARFFRPIDKVS
jgi:hypothetical protein